MSFYGNVANVKTLSGIRASDFSFDTDAVLDVWIEARLTEIKQLIERDRNRSDFVEQGWKEAIDGIADRWMAGLIRFAMAHRDSPIIRVDDFQVTVPADEGPGKGVLADLHRFPKKLDARSVISIGVVSAHALRNPEED